MIKIIYYIILAVINLYGLYFIITALLVLRKEKKDNNKESKINYFSILIPARNEEKVIKNLIYSLEKQNYSKDKYEINVILNNSTDNTENVVKSTKANLIKCKNKINNKGQALKEAFYVLKDKKEVDAYIIFDADNIADKDFLKYMNESINNGYKVAQGFRDTKNETCNWISASYTMYYYIQNLFFNKARKHINKSASLNGTGFMIKKDVIEEIGFNTKTLSEDIEFTGLCALYNIKIDFVEKAITYDEQSSDFKTSWKQRKRWSKGCIQCFNNYSKEMIKNTNNISNIDMFLVYLAPIVQILTLLIFPFGITFQLKTTNLLVTVLLNIVSFLIAYIFQILICIISIKAFKKDIKKYYKGILLFPIFLLTWIPINIIILLKKEIKWEHIEHNKNISIEQI